MDQLQAVRAGLQLSWRSLVAAFCDAVCSGLILAYICFLLFKLFMWTSPKRIIRQALLIIAHCSRYTNDKNRLLNRASQATYQEDPVLAPGCVSWPSRWLSADDGCYGAKPWLSPQNVACSPRGSHPSCQAVCGLNLNNYTQDWQFNSLNIVKPSSKE